MFWCCTTLQFRLCIVQPPTSVPVPLPERPRDHLEVFRRNGFDFVERQHDGRLVLLAAPEAPGATGHQQQQQQVEDPLGGQGSGSTGGAGEAAAEAGLMHHIGDDELVFDGGADGSQGGGAGELLLSAVPVSGSTFQLGPDDVAELVAMIKAGEGSGSRTGSGSSDSRAWEDELRPSRCGGRTGGGLIGKAGGNVCVRSCLRARMCVASDSKVE